MSQDTTQFNNRPLLSPSFGPEDGGRQRRHPWYSRSWGNEVPRIDRLYRWHVRALKFIRSSILACVFLLGMEDMDCPPPAVSPLTATYHWRRFANTQNSGLLTGNPSEPISRLA